MSMQSALEYAARQQAQLDEKERARREAREGREAEEEVRRQMLAEQMRKAAGEPVGPAEHDPEGVRSPASTTPASTSTPHQVNPAGPIAFFPTPDAPEPYLRLPVPELSIDSAAPYGSRIPAHASAVTPSLPRAEIANANESQLPDKYAHEIERLARASVSLPNKTAWTLILEALKKTYPSWEAVPLRPHVWARRKVLVAEMRRNVRKSLRTGPAAQSNAESD